MKKLKLLFFVYILFISFNVFADSSYNMTSLITSPVNYSECGNGSYAGVELNGATNCWNTNVRYQGTLNRIFFNLPAPSGSAFEPDTSYRLTLNMATQDWRNNFGTVVVSPGSSYTNNFVDTFTFVSMKQVNITFTVPYSGSTSYQYLWVNLPARSTSHLITGTSNWNLSNVTLTKLTSGSSGGSTNPSGPSTTFDDTAIINNNNENTQNVINNQNQNTEDIINNNNENTESINDSLNSFCKNTTLTLNYDYVGVSGSYLNNNGELVEENGSATSKYFVIKPNTSYTISHTVGTTPNYYYYCLYTATKSLLSCSPINTSTDTTFIASSYASYLRVSMYNYRQLSLTGNICNNWEQEGQHDIINNQNQNTEDIINNQNSNAQQTQETINNNLNTCKEDIPTLIGTISGKYLYCNNSKCSFQLNNSRSVLIYESKPNTNYRFRFLSGSNIRIGTSDTLYDDNVIAGNYYLTESYTNSSPVVGIQYSFITFGKYIYVYLQDNGSIEFFSNGQTDCKNKLDDINDTLNNSNIENGVGDDFFDNFNNNMHGLSSIITIPLTSIQSLSSSQCTPLRFPIPFTDNKYLDVPCMTEIYQQHVPTLLTLIQTCWYGILAYKVLVNIFGIVKGFKDPDSDKIEVMDL